MIKNNDLKINKIDKSEKSDNLDIKGQGCWDDCKVYVGNTTTPKCQLQFTAQDSFFL